MTTPISIFISYARTDSAFVDRLEADLQARSFYTWVDRRKLEGGQSWVDELQQAIDRCDILLIVLSPDAVESKFVRMEYRYAQTLNKSVIPLEFRPCPKVPIDLNGLQWVDFQTSYDQGLTSLLATLSRITPIAVKPPTQPLKAALSEVTKEPDLVVPQPSPAPPATDLNTLYRQGIIARTQGDLERAAALWQQVLDRDPYFGNKTLATLMEQLQKEIHPYRVNRLRERAKQAQQAGEWGQEIGAWQALLGLEPDDEEAIQAIANAQENQQHAWMYENALQFAQERQIAAAKYQLETLWQFAPKYGDPANIGVKYFPIPTLNPVYRGQYTNISSGQVFNLQLTIKLQRKNEIEANISFGNGVEVGSPYKGAIYFSGTIFLKLTSGSSKSELRGNLLSNGSIRGTFTWDLYNYNFEVYPDK